jgi:RNA polymerase sigma-70 factor (ECF subfamily)
LREYRAGGDGSSSVVPEEEVTRREVQRQVRTALLMLPERDAKMLVLSQSGFSYQELAGIIGVAPSSVGTLLARARCAFLAAYDGGK